MRLPPHSLEAEQAVLGILLRAAVLAKVVQWLAPEDFYQPKHEAVYRAMLAIADRGEAVDPVTVLVELQKMKREQEVAGGAYLGELASGEPTATNIEHYCRIVRETSLLRQLINRANEIAAKAYDQPQDVRGFLDEAERSLFELSSRSLRQPVRSVKELLRGVVEELQARSERPNAITGVPTGFADFDKLTGGLQPADVVILAARPSLGKTSFATCAAINAGASGVPVLFFSVEMSGRAIVERMVYSQGRVDSARARAGTLDAAEWSRVFAAASQLHRTGLWIDENAATTLGEIRAKVRRWRADPTIFPKDDQHGLVVVDYLQLVRLGRRADSREQEVAEVSRGLKAIAKEMRVPVLVLSQLNRRAEERDGAPRLSDLRESGALEQDSDVVAFLHREGADNLAPVTLTIAKQRNGPTGFVLLTFLPQYTLFLSHESAVGGASGRAGWGGNDDPRDA